MTREHKLALIVGFSLILLVGVLISDHLSKAKQAKIAPVTTADLIVSEVKPNLASADGTAALQPPLPAQPPVTVVQNPPAPAPSPEPATTRSTPATPDTVLGGNEPRRADWASGHGNAPDSLERQLRDRGARFENDARGNRVVYLPPLGQLDPGRIEPAKTAPTPPVRTAAANVALYTVQKGDTLVKIATATYGSAKLWHELAKYNNISESALRLGAQIKLPAKELLTGKPTETAAAPIPPGAKPTIAPATRATPLPAKPAEIRYATYTVKAGDTLGHISQQRLGSSKRVQEIIDLNKLDDEDSISVGTVLKLPVMRG